MGYKINKTNMLATRINSSESYTKVMDLKIPPEPSNVLNKLQKKLSSNISIRLINYALNYI